MTLSYGSKKQHSLLIFTYFYVSWDWIINNSRLVLLKHSEEGLRKGIKGKDMDILIYLLQIKSRHLML